MDEKPLILLTNDDGIEAEGLRVLYECVSELGDVEIVAPDEERSAAGHSISIRKEMAYRPVYHDGVFWGHALRGTPADCVKLAVVHLLPRKPDLIVSGINPGANLGNNIFYSGTVAAAREGAMLGVPAVALSVQRTPETADSRPHYETAGDFIRHFAPRIIERGLPRGVILNINAPNLPKEEIRGVVVSRQGATLFVDKMLPREEAKEIRAFSNVGDQVIRSDPAEKDRDDVVLSEKKISVTPLHYELTHHGFRSELSEWLE